MGSPQLWVGCRGHLSLCTVVVVFRESISCTHASITRVKTKDRPREPLISKGMGENFLTEAVQESTTLGSELTVLAKPTGCVLRPVKGAGSGGITTHTAHSRSDWRGGLLCTCLFSFLLRFRKAFRKTFLK